MNCRWTLARSYLQQAVNQPSPHLTSGVNTRRCSGLAKSHRLFSPRPLWRVLESRQDQIKSRSYDRLFIWCGSGDSSHLRRPQNFCPDNKLLGEGSLANSHRLFSPRPLLGRESESARILTTKKPDTMVGRFRGAGRGTLTPGLVLGKDAL